MDNDKKTTKHYHMCVNIAGLFRSYGRKKMNNLFFDENGKACSDKEVRSYLAECQLKGWKVLPMTENCEGFDYFG